MIFKKVSVLILFSSLCYSQTKAWENDSWNWDGDDKNLSDGDHIVLKKNCDQGVEDGKVRFGLVCSGTWWKAITLHQGQGHYLSELVAVQDEPGITKYADVDHSSLELYDYVLSKAKTFGVHTDMYRISNVQDAKAGCAYTFEWLRD